MRFSGRRKASRAYHLSCVKHGTLRVSRYKAMQQPPTQPARTGPSRDMIGAPWLGLIVFVLIAIALGWGLTQVFKGMADQTRQSLHSDTFAQDFDPARIYILQTDMLLGIRAKGDVVLVPFKDEMPVGVQGRYTWPTRQQYIAQPEAYNESHDLVGIIEAGTHVRFDEVIEDDLNPQTRVLVMTYVLTGPYKRKAPVLGMYLESVDRDDESGATRYKPRADLFEIFKAQDGPVQSGLSDQTVQ